MATINITIDDKGIKVSGEYAGGDMILAGLVLLQRASKLDLMSDVITILSAMKKNYQEQHKNSTDGKEKD